ncbi:hypothetical protein Q5752_001537 [Cryptotrichosporon argae]
MFKKRARPASVRDKAAEGDPVPAPEESEGDAGGQSQSQALDDLLVLRRLKRSMHQPGTALDKLNRGEARGQRRADDEGGDAGQRFGLQATRPAARETQEKRLVRTDNFTQQTNALDVDKHMMAYIETEMAKRRGADEAAATPVDAPHDPHAELYRLAERYRAPAGEAPAEEGTMKNSLGMLSAIPEVDLGMENRLRNIEETEKAKRELYEQRKAQAPPGRREEDVNYANARFFKHPAARVASDVHAQMENARREAAGLDPIDRSSYERRRAETASDEAVYERFKKRAR